MVVRFETEELETIRRNYIRGQGGGFGGWRAKQTLDKLQLLIDSGETVVVEVPESK